MPVIGFFDSRSPDALLDRLRGFRQGLKDNGFVEGDNVTIVYRWAGNQFDQLPELTAELVRRRVAVIAATGLPIFELGLVCRADLVRLHPKGNADFG